MLNAIRMPQMGVSDESAILSKWLVREGDRVRRGQPVFSLETDKATFQYEAESDGYLVRVLAGEGEEAAVSSPVGILCDAEDIGESELETFLRELEAPDEKKQPQTGTGTGFPHEEHADDGIERVPVQHIRGEKRKASPRARKKADELGVNLETIRSGSGPEGRIIEQDVLHHASPNRTCNVPERITAGILPGRPLTQTERIGMRPVCTEAAGQAGFVSRMIDVQRVLSICTPQNRLAPGTVICYELAKLLARTPELNARRHGDRIYEYDTVHLRLTVETSSGTLKPVIRCAEAYTADELAVLMRNAAGRCVRFDSKPQEFREGTFTVADLSAYGTDFFTPEITPPELCALGIGAVVMQTKTNGRGETGPYPAIRLTLAYDRAGVDSIRAAGFLNELAALLEPAGTKH